MDTNQVKKLEIDFFSKFKDGNYDVFTEDSYRILLKFFGGLARRSQDKIIVDLGCGSGSFSMYLNGLGIKLLGIDLCFNLVEVAKQKVMNSEFIVGDVESLPLADESVDLISFSGILHHLPSLEKAAKEAWRVLKKGGRCFAYDPNKKNPIMWLYRYKRSPFYSSKGVTFNERLLTKEDLSSAFLRAGFKVNIFAISGLSYKYIEDKKKSFFLSVYNKIDRFWGTLPFSKKYGSFLITLAKK